MVSGVLFFSLNKLVTPTVTVSHFPWGILDLGVRFKFLIFLWKIPFLQRDHYKVALPITYGDRGQQKSLRHFMKTWLKILVNKINMPRMTNDCK